ncbi:MAG: hypothetical protein KKB30_05450 [Proteobacteria bacterium]|nr:hypothetical protein [Pseudomonadota bacterium]MBU1716145.1 hypothetical protein [Pseudomonadota bacterium]
MDLSDDIKKDFARALELHQRVSSDYKKCMKFNKLMSDLLARLEDGGYYRLADRVMTILLDCNPKEGSSCEKSILVEKRVNKF